MSAVAAVFLHEKIMLLLQIISGVVQSFSETLEMHDFPFSQEAQWREHIGVIRQVDEIFVVAAVLQTVMLSPTLTHVSVSST